MYHNTINIIYEVKNILKKFSFLRNNCKGAILKEKYCNTIVIMVKYYCNNKKVKNLCIVFILKLEILFTKIYQNLTKEKR